MQDKETQEILWDETWDSIAASRNPQMKWFPERCFSCEAISVVDWPQEVTGLMHRNFMQTYNDSTDKNLTSVRWYDARVCNRAAGEQLSAEVLSRVRGYCSQCVPVVVLICFCCKIMLSTNGDIYYEMVHEEDTPPRPDKIPFMYGAAAAAFGLFHLDN